MNNSIPAENTPPSPLPLPGDSLHRGVGVSGGKQVAGVFLCIFCSFLNYVNIGAITAATPDLSGTFVVGALDVSWAGASCPMGMVAAFCLSGYLWSRLGIRKSMRVALSALFIGSILALIADHFLLMIISRVLQGAGGGMTLVFGTGILMDLLTGKMMKFWSTVKISVIGVASCLSPVIGCLLVQYWNWRGLFVIVAVCAFLMILLNEWCSSNHMLSKQDKFDWTSFSFLFLGCISILMVITNGEIEGWSSFTVIAWFYAGISFFILTFLSCFTHKTPLLNVRHLLTWRFTLGLLVALCNLFCICWLRVSIVQFMRNVLGYEPVHIAYVFIWPVLSFALFTAIMIPLVIREWIAPRVTMMLGLTLFTFSAFLMTRLDTGTSQESIILALVIYGVAYSFCLLSATALVLRAIKPQEASSANRLLNASRNIVIAIVVSAASTILTHTTSLYRYSVEENTSSDHPGVSYTLNVWTEYFKETGANNAEVHAGTNTMLGKAYALQSKVFSMNSLFMIAVLVGASGTFLALFCLRPNEHKSILT